MSGRIFKDRQDAGRELAAAMKRRKLVKPVILGLPRGGVPVAYEVAVALKAPLDVMVVRKLGAPFQPELAIGAIASGGVRVLNEELIADLSNIDDAVFDEIADRESKELSRREELYRGDRPLPKLEGRDVVLVDDGMATGATMRAAAQAVRRHKPSRVIVAVPTASADAVRLVQDTVDEVVCLDTPAMFFAVGSFYRHFDQTPDEEVRRLLDAAARAQAAS
jgi:predicted phosphoribosyltransferase